MLTFNECSVSISSNCYSIISIVDIFNSLLLTQVCLNYLINHVQLGSKERVCEKLFGLLVEETNGIEM